jgi:hypothetical protein
MSGGIPSGCLEISVVEITKLPSSRVHISTSPHIPTASQAKSKDATQRELGCAAVGLGLQSGGAAAVAWAGHIPQTLVALLGTDAVVGVRKEVSVNNNNKHQQTPTNSTYRLTLSRDLPATVFSCFEGGMLGAQRRCCCGVRCFVLLLLLLCVTVTLG